MAEEKEVVEAEEIDIDALSDAEVSAKLKEMEGSAEPEGEEGEPKEAKKEEAPEKQELIPHAKFHQANERRKAAEERANAAERASTIAMQRLAELLQASQVPQQQQQPQGDLRPPPDADPLERLAWHERQTERLTNYITQRDMQQMQAQQQHALETQAVNQVGQYFIGKIQERPELKDAYDHLLKSLGHEFAAQGWQGMNPDGTVNPNSPLAHQLREHEKQHVLYCYQANIPIDTYYEGLAKARGWNPEGQAERPRNPDGTFASKEAEKIDKREATKQKAKSLGGSGAPVDSGDITPETLVNMSDEDFAAYKKKYGDNALRRVFETQH